MASVGAHAPDEYPVFFIHLLNANTQEIAPLEFESIFLHGAPFDGCIPSGAAFRLIGADTTKNKRNHETKQGRTQASERKAKIICVPHLTSVNQGGDSFWEAAFDQL